MDEVIPVSATFYGNHNRTILEIFNKQREDPSFHEVTVKINEREFYGHRALLCALSPYFNGALNVDMKEKWNSEIKLSPNYVTPTAMQLLMDYIYTAAVKIDHENAGGLLSAANYLQMNELKTYCQEFLSNHLSPENSLTTLASALMSDSDELTETAELVIKHYFETVLKQEEFLKLEKPFVVKIFSLINKQRNSAKEMNEALVSWVKHNREERQEDFPELLKKIKLRLLPTQFLKQVVSMEELVQSSTESKDYLQQEKYRCAAMPALVKELRPSKKRKHDINNYFVVIGERVRLFNIYYQTWTHLFPLKTEGHISWIYCVHRNQFLYAISSEGQILELDMFNVNHEGWRHVGRTMEHRRRPAALSLNGVIVITGGMGKKSVETFDPISKGQFVLPSMPEVRFGHTMVERFGNLVCIGGVHSFNGAAITISPTFSEFNPKIPKWVELPEREDIQHNSVEATMLNNDLFVIDDDLTIHCYNGNSWRVWGTCPRSILSSISSNRFTNTEKLNAIIAKQDHLLVAVCEELSKTFHIISYDPTTNEWKKSGETHNLGFGCTDILSF